MTSRIDTRRIARVCTLFVESGAITLVITALALFVRPDTWLWDMTKGGNRIAWLIPPAIAAGLWFALREPRLSVKRFAIGVHVLFMLVLVAVLIVNWVAPFPD